MNKTDLHRPVDRPTFMPEPELPSFSEEGVDLTFIRWMLSLSYKERLQILQDFADFTGKVNS